MESKNTHSQPQPLPLTSKNKKTQAEMVTRKETIFLQPLLVSTPEQHNPPIPEDVAVGQSKSLPTTPLRRLTRRILPSCESRGSATDVERDPRNRVPVLVWPRPFIWPDLLPTGRDSEGGSRGDGASEPAGLLRPATRGSIIYEGTAAE